MLAAIAGWFLSGTAGVIFKVFGDTIIQPLLQAYLKSKDVDMQKFIASDVATTQIAVAILDANTKFAQVKSTYAMAVLQWWPFRLVLFLLLAFCSVRFILIIIDSTWWFIFGCELNGRHVIGEACTWSIPAIKGIYGGAELQFLLFFVVMKPVDSAITGALNLTSKYLAKK